MLKATSIKAKTANTKIHVEYESVLVYFFKDYGKFLK